MLNPEAINTYVSPSIRPLTKTWTKKGKVIFNPLRQHGHHCAPVDKFSAHEFGNIDGGYDLVLDSVIFFTPKFRRAEDRFPLFDFFQCLLYPGRVDGPRFLDGSRQTIKKHM